MRLKPGLPLSFLTLALIQPGFAHAAEADTGEDESAPIVVTAERSTGDVSATKTDTPLIDTPQSVVTLERQQIDDQGMESLGDALRYVPGVTLGQGEGHRDQVVIRGQASTADFFVDGLRDDAQYYRPLYNVQQVEVLKGPNALLFGRGGGGGIVNRVTKRPEPGKTALSASAALDSFGGWSLAADANAPLGEQNALRINATYEDLESQRDFFSGRFVGIAPSLAIDFGPSSRLTLAFEYASDSRLVDRGVPSLGGQPLGGYDRTLFGSSALNHGTVEAHLGRVRLDHAFSDNLKLDLTGQYAWYDKYYANVLPASATASTVTLSGYDGANTRSNWIGQANLTWSGQTGPLAHTLLVGAELGDQASTAQRRNVLFANGAGTLATTTVALAPVLSLPALSWTAPVSSSRTSLKTTSFYLQDQIELTPWLQLIGGIRYDRFDLQATNRLTLVQPARIDGVWSPRFGLVLKPRENLSVYASYAKSFLPQSGDQFSTLDPSFQSLAPEAFRNIELGVKWDITPELSFTSAVFQLDRSNTRMADPANPGFWLLSGSSRAKGLELSLAGRITPNWQLSLGYTWQEGTIRTATSAAPAGRSLDKLPHHQASLWTRYDLSPRLGLGLGVVHQSGQYATISNAVWLSGFTRIDAAVYFDLSDRVGLQLNVENVTDAGYYASAHTDNNIQPGKPLSAKVSLRVKF